MPFRRKAWKTDAQVAKAAAGRSTKRYRRRRTSAALIGAAERIGSRAAAPGRQLPTAAAALQPSSTIGRTRPLD